MPRPAPTHCTACGVELTEATGHRRTAGGSFRSHCTECRRKARRARSTTEEQSRRLYVDRVVCDICGQPERQRRAAEVRMLNKDHDHLTGEWRGLLCSRCNKAIGLFSDNIPLLEAAIRYLRNPPGLVLLDDEPPSTRIGWGHSTP